MTPASEHAQPSMISHPADGSNSGAFTFSAFFQSSPLTVPSLSLIQPTPNGSQKSNKSILRDHSVTSFIGFSWGPSIDAFSGEHHNQLGVPSFPSQIPQVAQQLFTPLVSKSTTIEATPQRLPFMTPVRPAGMTPFQTLPRASTVRRTAQRRTVSDREAMKQLVSCVGMSARKKVLESGRKPRILTSGSRGSRSSTLKELRFDRSVMVVNGDGGGVSYRMEPTTTSESGFGTLNLGLSASLSGASSAGAFNIITLPDPDTSMESSDAPPSPSPSPRPGSAMSLMSRRSQTPTATSFNPVQPSLRSIPSTNNKGLSSPTSQVEPVWLANQNTRSIVVNDNLSYDALDELQKKHDKLMQDILRLSTRLEEVSTRISGNS